MIYLWTVAHFQVMVANQEQIECLGVCHSLKIHVQGYVVTANYYVLSMVTCQLILGVQWLATFSPVEIDYAKLAMTFQYGGVSQTFHGFQQ